MSSRTASQKQIPTFSSYTLEKLRLNRLVGPGEGMKEAGNTRDTEGDIMQQQRGN